MINTEQLFINPAPTIAALQAILETGSRWAEHGTDPHTGVSCWGLVRFAYACGGVELPASACEASEAFTLVTRPYQPWDMVMANFSGMLHGPRHVGVLLGETWGFHCSQATNGLAHFDIQDRLWRRALRHVWRLKELVSCI